MADVSTLTIEDQGTYNIKDAVARNSLAHMVTDNTAQNITAQKTFKANMVCEQVFSTKMTNIASNSTIPSDTDPARPFTWKANDDSRLADIFYQRLRTSGWGRFLMRLYDPTGGSAYTDFVFTNGGSGQRYIWLPESPAQSDSSNKVATTSWVNTKTDSKITAKFKKVNALPANPDANTWYAIPE